MAYIDREQVCENCNNKNYCEKEKCPVYKVSIADVVPKSEVERLREINSLLTETGQEWQKRYENLAREIFEEIERTCIDTFGTFYIGATHGAFAKLKKKYTEV